MASILYSLLPNFLLEETLAVPLEGGVGGFRRSGEESGGGEKHQGYPAHQGVPWSVLSV
ncbi:MAG: hypothetical protein ACI9VR_004169 [Cognaticolwellia sp.]|jgi:hypothetical protein